MNSTVYVNEDPVELRAFQAVLDTGSSVITASTADANTINAVSLLFLLSCCHPVMQITTAACLHMGFDEHSALRSHDEKYLDGWPPLKLASCPQ